MYFLNTLFFLHNGLVDINSMHFLSILIYNPQSTDFQATNHYYG